MAPDEYFWHLSVKEAVRYASRAGTSRTYLKNHLWPRDAAGRHLPPRRMPSLLMVCRLADASEGHVTREGMFTYFAVYITRGVNKTAKGVGDHAPARMQRFDAEI